jgi:hypothetical protein
MLATEKRIEVPDAGESGRACDKVVYGTDESRFR